ncbi:MAG: M23 family metallopeptidase [Leptospiraceae bacterium]|nr:M23 family metallopeptidase [Leptospiraceae bacterium]MCP5486618.1 M23 family metallopeptidase [Spirochaetales bacterium]
MLETRTPGVGDYARHLSGSGEPRRAGGFSWKRFRERSQAFFEEVHRRGRERLTIMVIPHTEKKILNLHVSLYAITLSSAALLLVLVISIVSLVGKSGEDVENYDMGLTNSQFNLQSVKMAEEMMPLHELIQNYTGTIADLYVKLDGDESRVAGQGGVAQAVTSSEVEQLRTLVDRCRAQGTECSQELTEEILRQVLYLSEQDNHNLRRAVEVSEQILAELGTREKQNLLRHTPSIWPTRGYLLSPYGWQMDQFQGREVFQRGIEIGAVPGSEVVASAPGDVIDVTYDANYGLQIVIQHRFGIKTYYAHLDRTRVSKGDSVSRGQVIGYVGRSGRAPVYMLYYEVHIGSVAYNPHAFLNHLQDQWLIQPRP